MPGPELRLHTLRKAVASFRSTPGRQGRVVTLEDTDEVLVAGDLHGNLENFRRLLQRADLAQQPRRHLVLQEAVHGPYQYPTGGDKSHQLLDLIAALKCQYPQRVHFLLGNHELSQVTNRRITKNDADLNDLFRLGVETAYGPRADEVYAIYEELLDAVPVAVRTPNRIFVSHSVPSAGHLLEFDLAALRGEPTDPAEVLPGGSIHSLVWGRDVREETVADFLRKADADLLITGHIPCERGFDLPSPRHLIVDCMTTPAGFALLPTNRTLTPDELVSHAFLL
jgi:hypothetical protein